MENDNAYEGSGFSESDFADSTSLANDKDNEGLSVGLFSQDKMTGDWNVDSGAHRGSSLDLSYFDGEIDNTPIDRYDTTIEAPSFEKQNIDKGPELQEVTGTKKEDDADFLSEYFDVDMKSKTKGVGKAAVDAGKAIGGKVKDAYENVKGYVNDVREVAKEKGKAAAAGKVSRDLSNKVEGTLTTNSIGKNVDVAGSRITGKGQSSIEIGGETFEYSEKDKEVKDLATGLKDIADSVNNAKTVDDKINAIDAAITADTLMNGLSLDFLGESYNSISGKSNLRDAASKNAGIAVANLSEEEINSLTHQQAEHLAVVVTNALISNPKNEAAITLASNLRNNDSFRGYLDKNADAIKAARAEAAGKNAIKGTLDIVKTASDMLTIGNLAKAGYKGLTDNFTGNAIGLNMFGELAQGKAVRGAVASGITGAVTSGAKGLASEGLSTAGKSAPASTTEETIETATESPESVNTDKEAESVIDAITSDPDSAANAAIEASTGTDADQGLGTSPDNGDEPESGDKSSEESKDKKHSGIYMRELIRGLIRGDETVVEDLAAAFDVNKDQLANIKEFLTKPSKDTFVKALKGAKSTNVMNLLITIFAELIKNAPGGIPNTSTNEGGNESEGKSAEMLDYVDKETYDDKSTGKSDYTGYNKGLTKGVQPSDKDVKEFVKVLLKPSFLRGYISKLK